MKTLRAAAVALSVLLTLAACGAARPDVPELTSVGPTRELPQEFFGFNAASLVRSENVGALLDPTLQSHLRSFPTRLLRIPSGTAAQWIDWRTGRFINSPMSPFAQIPPDRRPITMADWAVMLKRTGAEPVWDLNVLNATMEDQLEMLDTASRLGLPVHYVELGNELWDPRATYPERFPTGAEYASRMNEWITALRRRFPSVRIGVSGADTADTEFGTLIGERYRDWNRQVLSTIRGADALVVHQYWGLPDRASPGSDVAATLRAGLDHWRKMQELTLRDLPDDLDIWITEWNQASHFVSEGTQIWAQALSVVAVGMEHMLEPRVSMSLVHNIVDGRSNPHDIGVSTVYPAFTNGQNGTVANAPTALGYALPLLFSTAAVGSSVQRVELTGTDITGTDITGTDPSGTGSDRAVIEGVHGVMVSGRTAAVLLVNETGRSQSVHLPDSIIGPKTSRTTLTSISAPPGSSPGWTNGDRVGKRVDNRADIGAPVELPPYSIVQVLTH